MKDLLIEILKHYGLEEVVGKENNPEIVKMFSELGFDWIKDDETAWCSAMLNYFCMKLGYKRSGKLSARSWLSVGTEVKVPELGDIVVLWRSNINSWEGHVGLFISKNEKKNLIYVLGGNQGNMLSIRPYHESRVLGYRKIEKV